MDSTYKTNSERLELFAIIGKVLGLGFPVGYLLAKQRTNSHSVTKESERKKASETFFKGLNEDLLLFQPTFFFTEKDFSQRNAIQKIYNVIPSICIWLIKRAILKKLKLIIKVYGKTYLSPPLYDVILNKISDDYHAHPVFCQQRRLLNKEQVRV